MAGAEMTKTTDQKNKLRNKMFTRQRGKCCYCGKPMTQQRGLPDSATIEHVIPKSFGGELERRNTKLAHFKCNVERGNKMGLPDHILGIAK